MVIYKTTNLINGKIYIGKDLKNNPKYFGSGYLIIKAIKKYGKENFIKEILEYCLDKWDMDEAEKFHIMNERSQDPKIGYNIHEGGQGGDLITNNPNKEKICNNRKGENNPMYNKTFYEVWVENYGIVVADKKMEMFSKKISEIEIKRNNLLTSDERKVLYGNYGEKNGMYNKSIYNRWIEKYGIEEANKRQKESSRKQSESTKGIPKEPFTKEHRKNIGKAKKRKVIQYDLEMNYINEYDSIKSAMELTKINNIWYCCRGIYKKAGGFIWKYKDEKVGVKF